MKKKICYLLMAVFTFLLGAFVVDFPLDIDASNLPKKPAASSTYLITPPAEIGTGVTERPVANREDGYVGCWNGMGGGRLKITRNKIYDLGSKESATIKDVLRPREQVLSETQTGEIYVLDTGAMFRKSFLSRIVELSFDKWGTVGIRTYDSREDYLADRISGQGLFEKVDCSPERSRKEWLEYEPAVVELEGKLIIKTFFGPPNFGEEPKTDSEEDTRILVLDKPINVKAKDETDPVVGPSAENVRELQLVFDAPLRKLVGKKLIVKGTLFHAFTGHHFTDVLMKVESIRVVH